ncbi:tripartite tricarboxylate transporter TctB family protein [soil metagenome]
MNLKPNADFWSGVLFSAVGIAGLVIGRDYKTGTASQMGPGFFPRALAVILVTLGAAIVVRAFLRASPDIKPFAGRPLLLIVASVVAFALLLDSAGIAIAGTLLVIGCRLAGSDFRLKEVLISALVLVGGAIAIFSYGLTIPFKTWPF